jgi:hypothetical protein
MQRSWRKYTIQKSWMLYRRPQPWDKEDIRRFLGLWTYFCSFIDVIADIAKPLNLRTDEERTYQWSLLQSRFPATKCVAVYDTRPRIHAARRQIHRRHYFKERWNWWCFVANTDVQELVAVCNNENLSGDDKKYCRTRWKLLTVGNVVENFH